MTTVLQDLVNKTEINFSYGNGKTYLNLPEHYDFKSYHIFKWIESLFGKGCFPKNLNQYTIFEVGKVEFELSITRPINTKDNSKIKFIINVNNYSSRNDKRLQISKSQSSGKHTRIIIDGVKERIVEYAEIERKRIFKNTIYKQKLKMETIAKAGKLSKAFGVHIRQTTDTGYSFTFPIISERYRVAIYPSIFSEGNFNVYIYENGSKLLEFNSLDSIGVRDTITYINNVYIPCLLRRLNEN